MRALLPACTALLLPQQRQQQQPTIVLDPTDEELRAGGSTLTLALAAEQVCGPISL